MGYTPPYFNIKQIGAGVTTADVGNVTTDDLTILSNPVDPISKITLLGNSGIYLYGTTLRWYNNAADNYLIISFSNPDITIQSPNADKNLFFDLAGTGKLKFGTVSAHGDVACNGDVPFIDAGGTARKLMTTA